MTQKRQHIMMGLLIAVAIGNMGSSCDFPEAEMIGVERPELASFDVVKLISPSLSSDDQSAYQQDRYTLGPERRLLLAFRKLSDHVPEIDTTNGALVQAQITVTTGSATDAQATLQLCPIIRQWNMEASWSYAYLGLDGQWSQPGGDYDSAGCVKAASVNGQSLLFDMTQWFLDYPKARDVNYGFILISDAPITVEGEKSGSYSPRLLWRE